MALYLVQHGKALSKEEDPERPITKEGIEEATQVAHQLALKKITVSRIIHSGKSRAEDTARIFRHAIDTSIPIIAHEGLAPNDEINAFAETLDPSEDLLVVGHLPFLEKLLSLLVTGDSTQTIDKFINGGVIKLSFNQQWSVDWRIDP